MSMMSSEFPLDPEVNDRPGRLGLPLALTYEHVTWLLLFVAALLMRLCYLETAPLNNGEAQLALQSLSLLRDGSASVSNPLFASLQTLIFFLLGPSDFSARLISALAGSALCLLPLTLRGTLGRGRALALGALLVLSPSLWFAARQADGVLLAWLLALALWCAWRKGALDIAAATGGLLLACGANAIAPLLGVGVVLLIGQHTQRLSTRFWVITLVSFILGSTGLLLHPAGVGSVFGGIAAWFGQLGSSTGPPLGRVLMGVLFYELVLIVGALGAIAALAITRRVDRSELQWLAWISAGLILLAINRGRSGSDVVPVVIGLTGLAAWVLDWLMTGLRRRGQLRYEGTYAAIALGLLFFAGLGIRQYASTSESSWLMPILICVIMALALVTSTNLLGDVGIGVRAVVAALAINLLLYGIATGIRLNLTQPDNPAEAYLAEATQPELHTLAETVRTISTRAFGDPSTMPVQVSRAAPPALIWALRGQSKVDITDNVGDASVILTPDTMQPTPRGNSGFVGNGFVILARVSLETARCNAGDTRLDCVPLARWFAFRQAGTPVPQRWVLWVRGDVANKASGIQ